MRARVRMGVDVFGPYRYDLEDEPEQQCVLQAEARTECACTQVGEDAEEFIQNKHERHLKRRKADLVGLHQHNEAESAVDKRKEHVGDRDCVELPLRSEHARPETADDDTATTSTTAAVITTARRTLHASTDSRSLRTSVNSRSLRSDQRCCW